MRRIAESLRSNPCSQPVSTMFRRGISTQLIPSCDPNCDVGQVGALGWRVGSDRTLDTSRWVEGWIYNQLSTKAAVDCAESPLGEAGGGWWADAFRTDGFKTGSKLWSLQWLPTVNETLVTAKRYAEEALSYLVMWKVASKVVVDVAYISKTVLRLTVTVTGPGVAVTSEFQGQKLPDFGWLWTEYLPTARSAA